MHSAEYIIDTVDADFLPVSPGVPPVQVSPHRFINTKP